MEWIIPIVILILILVLRSFLRRNGTQDLPTQEEIDETLANDEEYQKSQAQLKQLIVYRTLSASVHDGMNLDELIEAFRQMCQLDVGEPDDLLFQTGTYGFTGKKRFQFDLTRQFQFLDPDEYVQLHLTVYYEPSAPLLLLRNTHWGDRSDNAFFDHVKSSRAYQICRTLPMEKSEVTIDET